MNHLRTFESHSINENYIIDNNIKQTISLINDTNKVLSDLNDKIRDYFKPLLDECVDTMDNDRFESLVNEIPACEFRKTIPTYRQKLNKIGLIKQEKEKVSNMGIFDLVFYRPKHYDDGGTRYYGMSQIESEVSDEMKKLGYDNYTFDFQNVDETIYLSVFKDNTFVASENVKREVFGKNIRTIPQLTKFIIKHFDL